MNTSARNELHQQTTETQAFIRKELALHTSPAVISGRLRLKHGVYVSKNTLYRYIKMVAGGDDLSLLVSTGITPYLFFQPFSPNYVTAF